MRLQRSRRQASRDGYDSDMDGDAQTIIASSGSSRDSTTAALLQKNLYPGA